MRLLFLLSACVVFATGRNLLDYFPSCALHGNVEICILETLESLRPRFKYGLPEIGFPPLDPFMVESLKIDTSIDNLKLRATATNIIVQGLSDFSIQGFGIDSRTNTFEIKVVLPYLTISADYQADGSKIFFVTLDGRGKFNGSFNGVTAVLRGFMIPRSRDGIKYLHIESLSCQISISHSELNMVPLKSSLAARAAAAYVNSHPDKIMDMATPAINQYTAPILMKYINKFIESVSFPNY